MRLRYELQKFGWAEASLECEGQVVAMTVSYLHDSLLELATAARTLVEEDAEARVIFMDEPGEHELILRRRDDDRVDAEVRWYQDWKSWGHRCGDGEMLLTCTTTTGELRDQVLSELHRLFRTHGEDGYRRLWLEHDFPTTEMRRLEQAATATGTPPML